MQKVSSSPPPPPPPPPPHCGHVFPQIKILRTVFVNCHPRNNPVILFQNLTSGFRGEEFWRISHKFTVKKASPDGGHVFPQIKISPTIFEKGHTRNNLVKLFHILTRGFRKDFLRISSCPYSAKSLLPMAAMFFHRSKFFKQFLKRVTQGTFLWNNFKVRRGVSEKKIF